MNCHEFRRLLMIDPRRREQAFLDHLQHCPKCAQEAEQAWQFENRLLLALAPADTPAPPPTAPWGFSPVTVTAALLLILSLSVWLGNRWGLYPGTEPQLEEIVREHIENEPQLLQLDHNLSASGVALILSGLGGRLSSDPGPIRYAGRCRIRRQQGVHLVVAGERGPITVLLMPGEHLAAHRRLDAVNLSGIIVPTDYGSMAVVGGRREPLEPVVEKMRQAVAWAPGK